MALELTEDELALLAVLLLRGPQTPGELNQRAARLYPFPSLLAVEEALERLVHRELVARHDRHAGQKEQRYAHLLGAGEEGAPGPEVDGAVTPRLSEDAERSHPVEHEPAPTGPADEGLAARVDLLEREMAELREQLSQLRAALGG